MTQPINGRRGQQAVDGEGLVELVEVEVAGDDGGHSLIALGDQVVQVFIGRRPKWFEPEVVDDEQRHTRQRGQLALIGAGGARSVQALRQARAGSEHHVARWWVCWW